ncbi:DUF4091 domain-containing protein [Corallococcus sp. BB11-1]|uniref:DUF4091 domain-containing protein n=1 Tax=Corallococcus sp. BB11-1 TaxID=2996783 RepID=UPI00226D9501|nr:glycoside hydrolase domain-containing protein [Corallococcus sp. BB11-1]MCY1032425.1 DUF4091 domain-containing protein [Corallococcus sp. BB11-1]
MRAGLAATARAFGLILALVGLAALAAPQVYGESFMVKVRPETPPRGAEPVELLAARNEAVSFQVVIHGGDSGATAVAARLGELSGPARIGGSQLTLYRQDFQVITQSSSGQDTTGRWPDALVPEVDEVAGEPRNAFPFDVPPRESRALWVDVLVPEDAPPGRYEGRVEVVAAGGFTALVPVGLTVVDAVLPSTPSYPTAFCLEPDLVCLAHTGREDCGSEDVRVELLGRYARLALDHRFTLSDIFVRQPTALGWEAFDAAYAPLLDGTAPTRLKGARMTSAQYMGPAEEQALADFQAHFSARGWLSRAFDYTADEPPLFSSYEELRVRASLVERAAPGLVRMVTTSLTKAQANGVEGLIGRISVLLQLMAGVEPPDVGPQRPAYDAFLSRPGTSLWLYQSCGSHGCVGDLPDTMRLPSYMIDHPAALNRAMPWLVFALQASGESYYETTARITTAWTDQWFYGGNGDGTLFYPGTPARIGGQSQVPLPSLRLKLLRAGVQDYEWLMRVVEGGDPEFAAQVVRELVPSPLEVSVDAAAFERAREKLIHRALELSPGQPPPGPVVSERPVANPQGCGCGGGAQGAVLLAGTVGLAWGLRRRYSRAHRPGRQVVRAPHAGPLS